jgi:hypothetical protein
MGNLCPVSYIEVIINPLNKTSQWGEDRTILSLERFQSKRFYTVQFGVPNKLGDSGWHLVHTEHKQR